MKAATCMYASAPDDAFVLGPLGGTSQVVLACGFSGHGFKSCRWWGRSSPIYSRPGRLCTTSRCSTSLRPPSQARVRTERDGVVIRAIYPNAPVRIGYLLPDLGTSLLEPLRRLGTGRSTISTMSCWRIRSRQHVTGLSIGTLYASNVPVWTWLNGVSGQRLVSTTKS